jgi:hypothetical protein
LSSRESSDGIARVFSVTDNMVISFLGTSDSAVAIGPRISGLPVADLTSWIVVVTRSRAAGGAVVRRLNNQNAAT